MGVKNDPLRDIIRSTENEFGAAVDLLVCGHTIHAASDIYGNRYPSRRRCWKCSADMPNDHGEG